MSSILLIEDDPLVSELLTELLSLSGYSVFTASDGDEGVELFKQQQPALVITDIYMPRKNGVEAILELVKINPDVRIIVISGGGNYSIPFDIMEHAEVFGSIPTLEKPVDHKLLLKTIEDMLSGRSVPA